MTTTPTNDEQLREAVRERYGHTALEVLNAKEPVAASCCGADCCGATANGVGDAVSSDLYSNAELGELPRTAGRCCAKPSASSCPAGVLPSPILSFGGIFRRSSALTLRHGPAVSPALWRKRRTGNCSLRQALPRSKSKSHGAIPSAT